MRSIIKYKIFCTKVGNKRVSKEWRLMARNKLSGTRMQNMKRTTCTGLRPVSKIRSLIQLIRSKQASEGKKLVFAERKALEVINHQKKNSDSVAHKTVNAYLPSLIRIRATDGEGNSIEVTY